MEVLRPLGALALPLVAAACTSGGELPPAPVDCTSTIRVEISADGTSQWACVATLARGGRSVEIHFPPVTVPPDGGVAAPLTPATDVVAKGCAWQDTPTLEPGKPVVTSDPIAGLPLTGGLRTPRCVTVEAAGADADAILAELGGPDVSFALSCGGESVVAGESAAVNACPGGSTNGSQVAYDQGHHAPGQGYDPTSDYAVLFRTDPGGRALAPRGPFTGDWVTFPGPTPFCDVRLARQPAVDVAPLFWAPCTDPEGAVIAGCVTTDGAGYRVLAPSAEPIVLVDGVPWFAQERLFVDPTAAMFVVSPLGGGFPVFAAGALDQCSVDGSVGAFGVAAFTETGGGVGVSQPVLGWAPWRALTDVTARTLSDLAHDGFDVPVVGATRIYGAGAIADPTTGALVLAPPTSDAASQLVASARGALFVSRDRRDVAALADDGAAWTTLAVSPADAGPIVAFGIDRARGESLAWSTATSPAWPSGSTWTDPGAPRLVVPKALAELVTNAGMIAGLEHFDATTSPPSFGDVVVARVSDGEGWIVAPPPRTTFVGTLWVDADEVFLQTGRPSSGGDVEYDGVVRVSLAALGPPGPLP